MHHTTAYLALLNRSLSVPETHRGPMLRALILLAREHNTVCEEIENDTFPGLWDPQEAMARVAAQAAPTHAALRSAATEVLRTHCSALAMCVHTDRIHSGVDPLGPVSILDPSLAPRIEALYFLGSGALGSMDAKERNRFAELFQRLLFQRCPHSVLVFQREGAANRLVIHHSTTHEIEQDYLAAWIEQLFEALMEKWQRRSESR